MTAFKLSKWYLDCVTESGDASIAYTGTVDWGLARLHYCSVLETNANQVTTRQSLRKQGEPKIHFDNEALLTMDHSLVIRDGPLRTTALSGIPGVNKTFPARILQVNECKWRSRAPLQSPNGTAVEGWVIHEKVSWPT